MTLFTVLGSTGFIGRHLVAYLKRQGCMVQAPPRDAEHLRGMPLGHVIYCIGTTGNFRQYPQAAVDAHVNKLYSLMSGAVFDSWLYLSSTRVYGGIPNNQSAREESALVVHPSADSLYDLTKMLGESVCFGQMSAAVRVARLSNVYGAGQSQSTFLGSILRDIVNSGKVVIGESSQSTKDYLSIEDAVFFLKEISVKGQERLYNVASGCCTSHEEIAAVIKKFGKNVTFAEGAASRKFPPIDISRLAKEFGHPKRNILKDIPDIISALSNPSLE